MHNKNLSYNPILPFIDCIPDGEPHVFGDRIYLFGSHDTYNGDRYCAGGDYRGWSAPLSDPGDWRCHGVIYEAKQDPYYIEGETNDLYAPDVVRGNDGRYYLYYNLVCSGRPAGFHKRIGVAVCDEPTGKYEYYGSVQDKDGIVYDRYLMSDPAVINDDGIIRLYCGWSLSMVAAGAHQQGKEDSSQAQSVPKGADVNTMLAPVYKMLFDKEAEDVAGLKYPLMGANTMELEDDMLTVRGQVKRIVPGQFDTPPDSPFYGHAFYEAASIRKIGGLYYFIYSSEKSNELCYATSSYPDKDFVYGGTIISNGDVGLQGRLDADRTNMTGNNHGSLECIGGQWYIFYHRHSNKSTFSRQACVEKINILKDGSIPQVPCTSMGFQEKPFATGETYPAGIACSVTNGHMPHCTSTKVEDEIPYITDEAGRGIVADIVDQTKLVYKYFDLRDLVYFSLEVKGDWEGSICVYADETEIARLHVIPTKDYIHINTDVKRELVSGYEDVALQFVFYGKGKGCMRSFTLNN